MTTGYRWKQVADAVFASFPLAVVTDDDRRAVWLAGEQAIALGGDGEALDLPPRAGCGVVVFVLDLEDRPGHGVSRVGVECCEGCDDLVVDFLPREAADRFVVVERVRSARAREESSGFGGGDEEPVGVAHGVVSAESLGKSEGGGQQ